MPAAKENLKIEQGADFWFGAEWKDGEGEPVDLTGYKARAQVRPRVDSDVVLVQFSSEGAAPNIELGGGDGTITLTLSAEETAKIKRSGVWDLELVAPSGAVDRFMQGNMILSPETTR